MLSLKIGKLYDTGASYYEVRSGRNPRYWLPNNSIVLVISETTSCNAYAIPRYQILVGEEIATIALTHEQLGRWRELK